MFIPVIEEHKKMLESGVVADDFIGRYLQDMEEDKTGIMTEKQLLNTIQVVFWHFLKPKQTNPWTQLKVFLHFPMTIAILLPYKCSFSAN